MFNFLTYILSNGIKTQKESYPNLPAHALGLPKLVNETSCKGQECNICTDICPTSAIDVNGSVRLDLGACIACGLCIKQCPEDVFEKDLSTKTAVVCRDDLRLGGEGDREALDLEKGREVFKQAISIRVVSTGCSACDLEVAATFNPIFDIERFGVRLVASPRAADALVVTGPVPVGMQAALLDTYEAMGEPRLVIAAGTCAISGGIHKGGYAKADGLSALLPVDVFIPGCPPHPWSIIHGIRLAMVKRIVSTLRPES